jgi:transmembrane sensor
MVNDEAALWVVRLSDPACPAEERERFEAWRDADPRHEVAFERESAAWEAMDRLRALRPALTAPAPDLLAPARRLGFPAAPMRVAAAIGAAVVLIAGVGGAVGFVSIASPAYATGIGERRVVRLGDGGSVELNTDSKIVVHRFGARPSVELVRGEALFSVGKGARPLLIRAKDRRIEAPTGQLAVRLEPGRVDVTVKAGSVMVATGGVSAAPLAAGSVGVYGPTGAQVRAVGAEEVDRSLAWRQGAIAFQGESLSQAVGEINRYNRTRIVVGDVAIGRLRVAGYFRSDDPRAFVQAVVRAFPVHATTDEDGSYRLARAG